MIHPHLLYGIVIWVSTFKTFQDKLSVLQNKALRIVAGGNWLDKATECYAKLNILKLDDLNKIEITKLMHRLANTKLLPQFFSFFTPKKSGTLANNATNINGTWLVRDGNRSGRYSSTGRSSRLKHRSNAPFLQLKDI